MNFDKYTQKAQEAISQTQQVALEFSHQSVEPAHLLLALLRQQDGIRNGYRERYRLHHDTVKGVRLF